MQGDSKKSSGQKLWLTEDDREAMKAFWKVYDSHYAEIAAGILDTLNQKPTLMTLIKAIPPEKLEEQRQASRERLRSALMDNKWDAYLDNLRQEGANYGQAGVGFQDWYELLSAYRSLVIRLLFQEYGKDQARLLTILNAHSKFSDQAMAIIGEAYLDRKENTIRQQQEAIQELSTPVLVLRERLLLLPIVGMLDSHRAQQLTEHLLQAIRLHRARMVVIDITGVLTVDSMVANHLIKTAEAARLMGAKVIITGLSTEIAQTLVRIGVDLSRLNTLGDLRSGIEEAEHMLGYKVIPNTKEKTVLAFDQDEAV